MAFGASNISLSCHPVDLARRSRSTRYPGRARVHRVITCPISDVSPWCAPMGLGDGAILFAMLLSRVRQSAYRSVPLYTFQRSPTRNTLHTHRACVSSLSSGARRNKRRSPSYRVVYRQSGISVAVRINNEPSTRSARSPDARSDAR